MKMHRLSKSIILFFLLVIEYPVLTEQEHIAVSENTTPNYISSNQYDINVLHYDLSIDLYPEKKLLKGDATITAVITNKNITQA